MISLTHLNGTAVAIDPSLIAWIDLATDTVVSLVGGHQIVVQESLDDIVDRISTFRAMTQAFRAPIVERWDETMFSGNS